jgi:hypothetical protein
MRDRELDLPRILRQRPLERPAAEHDAGPTGAEDLDLAPGEGDAGAKRLADRLLRGEAPGVVLGGPRGRVAVGALGLGEAACGEAPAVTLEGRRDPVDLDQVDSEPAAQRLSSSQSAS